jgi:hypothetical protein
MKHRPILWAYPLGSPILQCSKLAAGVDDRASTLDALFYMLNACFIYISLSELGAQYD